MNMVKNKYRSTLTNEHLHNFPPAWPSHILCPSLNHQKVSPFTQIRPDHITLLCIIRTFLLELCFWILTVTVPDPGLNGNLASGYGVILVSKLTHARKRVFEQLSGFRERYFHMRA